jgi:peptide/nickel transport system ATP-binding protein
MASIPRRNSGVNRKRRLSEIPGIVPNLRDPIPGCAFAPRCAYATDRCRAEAPPIRPLEGSHLVACWEAEKVLAS